MNEWIPVNKRLPKEHTPVLGTTKYNDIYIISLSKYRGRYKWYSDNEYDVPIVAWTPLPEDYTEEGD